METLYKSEIVTCTFDKTNQLVELQWNKNTHSDEYRKMFSAIKTFSGKHKIKLILSDIRKQGIVTIEDARWLDKEILSVAVSEKLSKLALVTEDTIFASAYTEMLKNKLDNTSIEVMVFRDNSVAKAWLLSK